MISYSAICAPFVAQEAVLPTSRQSSDGLDVCHLQIVSFSQKHSYSGFEFSSVEVAAHGHGLKQPLEVVSATELCALAVSHYSMTQLPTA